MATPAPPAPGLPTLMTVYPGAAEQARHVRADLRQFLNGCPVADDVILCASELVANAAIHSASRLPGRTFSVRAEVHQDSHVLILVSDCGGAWTDRPADPTRGRGLDIVRAYASDHGIITTAAGRTVWARFAWQSADGAASGPER